MFTPHRDSCPRIGDIMYNFGPFLRVSHHLQPYVTQDTPMPLLLLVPQMYSEYISNFENGLKVLEETQKKNPAFAELVKEFEVNGLL